MFAHVPMNQYEISNKDINERCMIFLYTLYEPLFLLICGGDYGS
jgi:hypothetical protein